MISGKMKLLSAVIGAAALIATPALASKPNKKKVSGRESHSSRIQPAYESNAIYGWEGQYRGWDPDPNIRTQLMRDQNLK